MKTGNFDGDFEEKCLTKNMSKLGADTKIIHQPLCRFIVAQIVKSRHKVNHIPLGTTAKAEKIIFIQLQTRVLVVVE